VSARPQKLRRLNPGLRAEPPPGHTLAAA
jgi:hypothetical protein